MRGGTGHLFNPERRAFGNLWRMWFSSQFLTPKDSRFGQVTLSPNWKAFPHKLDGIEKGDLDTYLKRMSDRGIKVMAAMANGFDERYNVATKSLPKNTPYSDKKKIESYSIYRKILQQTALRWGTNENDSMADLAEYGPGTWAPQEVKTGLNTVEYMQILNEVNGWPGVNPDHQLSGLQYAELFAHFVADIRDMDPNMKIIVAPTARFDSRWLGEFVNYWTATNRGWNDIYLSINLYPFNKNGNGNARTAEDMLTDVEEINGWLVDRNVQAFITEYGCNSEKIADLGYPDYPNLNKFECQAKLINDLTDLFLAQSNIVGATFYQLVDDPGEWRFSETGLLDKNSTVDPSEKPSYRIVREHFEQVPEPPSEYIKINSGRYNPNNNTVEVGLENGETKSIKCE